MALVYNSNSANGELGIGWSLEGLRSSIQRCPATVLHDGIYIPVGLHSEDNFCLDGNRLIHVGNNEYRTKAFSNMKVVAHNVDATKGPLKFTVHTSDGSVTTYGGWDLTSNILSSDGIRYQWQRSSVSFEGQPGWKVLYRTPDSTYMPNIVYKNKIIEFVYEDRPDSGNTVSTGYGRLIRNRTSQRLSRINVRLDSPYNIYTYHINYETVGDLSKSRITSITKKYSDGKALPPIKFEYTAHSGSQTGASAAKETFYSNANPGTTVNDIQGDFDGDGFSSVAHVIRGNNELILEIFEGNADSRPLVRKRVSHPISNTPSSVYTDQYFSGDFNGDGVSDLLCVESSGMSIIESKGKGLHEFTTVLEHFKPWSSYTFDAQSDIRIVDINADGRSDVVHVNGKAFRSFIRTDSGFSYNQTYYDTEMGYDIGYYLLSGDFNGDGRTDFVLPSSINSSNDQLTILVSGGNGRFSKHTTTPKAGRPITFNPLSDNGGLFRTADFNGDGITDIIHARANEKPAIFFGKGDGDFEIREQMFGNYNAAQNNDQMWFVDLNADGRDDALHAPNDNGFRILLSPGMHKNESNQPEFSAKDWVSQPLGFVLSGSSRFMFSDYNRDGAIDFSFWSYWDKIRVQYSEKDYSRLISKISTGRKQSSYTTFNYGRPVPFQDGSANTDIPDTRILKPAWPVVNSVSSNYNLNGDLNSTEYEYGDLRVHWNGGGLLGFNRIKRKDLAAQKETRTYYSHNISDFQHGMVSKVESFDTTGNAHELISSTVNNFETRTIDDRYFVFTTSSIQSGYSENGVTKNATIETTTLKPGSFKIDKTTSCLKTSNSESNPCLKTVEQKFTYHSTASLTGLEPEVYEKTTTTSVNYSALGMLTPANNLTSVNNVERYTYERGMIKTHTVSPGTANEIKQTYVYDFNHRKPTSVTTTGADIENRTSSTTYTPGGLVKTQTNALGHTATIYYEDSIFRWLPTRQVDPNNLTVTTAYDAQGRVYTVTAPNGNVSKTLWDWDWEQDSQGRGIKQIKVNTNAPTVTNYVDFLGRSYRTETYGYHNSKVTEITAYTKYDRLGRVIEQQAANYTNVNDHAPIEYFEYDSLGRIKRRKIPSDGLSYNTSYSTQYNVVSMKLNGVLRSKTRYWPTGQVKESIKGSTDTAKIKMHYDVFGNLATSIDPAGNRVKIYYDEHGRKTRMDDPDQGTWHYTYYADGTLRSQKDAKGQRSYMYYDLLGRMTKRIDKDNENTETGRSNWYYDIAANGIGKLYKDRSSNGFDRWYTYDDLGRVIRTKIRINESNYYTHTTYDDQGRVNTIKYPNGFTTRNSYEPITGVPLAVFNNSTSKVLKSFKSYTAKGQIEEYGLGDIIKGSSYFNPNQAGRVTSIQAWVLGPSIVNQRYDWDIEGNLKYRQDYVTGWREDFSYDDLNRLKTVAPSGTATGDVTSIEYDTLGNITFKTGVGSYAYDAPSGSPHAVSQAGNWSITYDANGNMVTKDGPDISRQTLAYTIFNKPSSISSSDGKVTRFWYGPNRSRFKRQDTRSGQTTTTHYAGAYEKITGPSGTTERLHIGGNVLVLKTNGVEKTNYLIKDHLGSTIAILNADGSVQERFSYDPWGKRRAPTDIAPIDVFSITVTQLATNRGYTGHEHIDGMGLIHMNGRVYDPTIARFLSADPIIQAPNDLQSYNRYAYVRNNPLRYTDPSGYSWWSKNVTDKFRSFRKNVSKAWRENWRSIVAIGVGVFMPGMLAPMMGKMGAAIATGGIAGGITGGTRGALVGMFTGGFLRGVGGSNLSGLQKTIAHGLIGGASSVANGGKFGYGFASMGFTKGINVRYGNMGYIGSTIVGGLASRLAGGSFKYGAISGTMSYALNTAMEMMQTDCKGRCHGISNMAEGRMSDAQSEALVSTVYSATGTLFSAFGCVGTLVGCAAVPVLAADTARQFTKSLTSRDPLVSMLLNNGYSVPQANNIALGADIATATVSVSAAYRSLLMTVGNGAPQGFATFKVLGAKGIDTFSTIHTFDQLQKSVGTAP